MTIKRQQRNRGSVLWAYVDAIKRQSKTLKEGFELMANNFEALTAAVDKVAANVSAVAEAIRNPATDNNSQPVIDDLAGRLEAAAAALEDATATEGAEDAGPSPTPPVE